MIGDRFGKRPHLEGSEDRGVSEFGQVGGAEGAPQWGEQKESCRERAEGREGDQEAGECGIQEAGEKGSGRQAGGPRRIYWTWRPRGPGNLTPSGSGQWWGSSHPGLSSGPDGS